MCRFHRTFKIDKFVKSLLQMPQNAHPSGQNRLFSKRLKILCLFIYLFLTFTFTKTTFASQVEIAIGSANLTSSSAKKEALHSALRIAVEQAVGIQISSETIVDNASVLKDKIYTHAEGFVEKWEILNETREDQTLILEVKAWVKEGRLNKALFLNGIDVRKMYEWVGHPRIVIIVRDYIDGKAAKINISQSELEEIFKSKGLTVLNANQIKNINKRDIAFLFKDPKKAKTMGASLGAEIVVTGKCMSNFSRKIQIGKFTQHFYSAFLQIQAYNTSTGEILLSSNYKNERKDLSALGPYDAATNAISNCIDSAKSDILFKIVSTWYDSFSKPRSYQLFIQNINYEKLQALEIQLYSLNNFRDLQIRRFEQNLAEIEIRYEGIKSSFVNDLLNIEIPLMITRESQNRIFLKVKGK